MSKRIWKEGEPGTLRESKQGGVLHGKRAFITGASGGIGAEIAVALAGHGCQLFLAGRSKQKLTRTIERCSKSTSSCSCDLTEIGAVYDTVQLAEDVLGGIDILVNCAGAYYHAPLEQTGLADYDHYMNLNVRVPFMLMQRLVPKMAERRWGRVVNICSSSSYHGFNDQSIYCASKHALLGLSRALHREFKGRGVRVFSISPGETKTEMGRQLPGEFGTFIDPAEIAHYVAFVLAFDGALVSEEIRLNMMPPESKKP